MGKRRHCCVEVGGRNLDLWRYVVKYLQVMISGDGRMKAARVRRVLTEAAWKRKVQSRTIPTLMYGK